MFRWLVGDWQSIGFVALSTVLIYLSVVIAVRLGERRTLTEMTTYDFAVAVALGSIIGRTATSPNPSYLQGVAAVAVLLACHHTLSLLRTHLPAIKRLTDRPPIELVRDGEVAPARLSRAHMTPSDLDVVLRQHGLDTAAKTHRVLLEANGTFTVIPQSPPADQC